MADKLSWFPFYVDEWETDENIRMMDFAEQGALLRLLCWQWREGSIPADEARIQRGLSQASHTPLSPDALRHLLVTLFTDHSSISGRLVNTKLAEVRKQQEDKSRSLAKAGLKGALSRERTRRMHKEIEEEKIQESLLPGLGISGNPEDKPNLPVLPARRGNSLAAVGQHLDDTLAKARGRMMRRDARRLASELAFRHWCAKFDHLAAMLGDERERPFIRAMKDNRDDGSKLLWAIDGYAGHEWATEKLSRHEFKLIFRDQTHIEAHLEDTGHARGQEHPLWTEFLKALRPPEPNGNGGAA